MRESLHSPAFLVEARDLGESDRLLTFFTKAEGKIRGVARGAKKSRKRFGAALDWFHLVRLTYRAGRSELCQIEDLEVIWRSARIAQNLQAYGFASYYLELVRELTPAHHAEDLLFDLLFLVLQKLDERLQVSVTEVQLRRDLECLSRFFEINLLDLLGMRPNLKTCSRCAQAFAHDEKGLSFCLYRAGLLCERCRVSEQRPLIPFAASTFADFQASLLQEGEVKALSGVFERFQEADLVQARRVLAELIRQHTHRPLRTLRFVEELAPSP